MPLIVLSIFYVPKGLHILADWLRRKFSKSRFAQSQNSQRCFLILFAVGAVICAPKLLRPIGIDKQGYIDAVKWLRENTAVEDGILTSDGRISFYAERKEETAQKAKFIVEIVKNNDKEPEFGRSVQKEYSVWINDSRKRKKLVIYRVL